MSTVKHGPYNLSPLHSPHANPNEHTYTQTQKREIKWRNSFSSASSYKSHPTDSRNLSRRQNEWAVGRKRGPEAALVKYIHIIHPEICSPSQENPIVQFSNNSSVSETLDGPLL